MTAAPPLTAVWTDVLWCLGIGVGLGLGRDLFGLLLGNGRVRCFLWDVLAFAAAAVLACGFAASVSAGGRVRWYMAAARAAGALGWRQTGSGPLFRLAAGLAAGLVFPLRWFTRRAAAPPGGRWADKKRLRHQKRAEKREQKAKKRKKVLQKPERMYYN